MKGGKEGRPRKSATGGPARPEPRGKPKQGGTKHTTRPSGVAPKKGSRKRPETGGSSSSGEE